VKPVDPVVNPGSLAKFVASTFEAAHTATSLFVLIVIAV
jgi:hypothetical protein